MQDTQSLIHVGDQHSHKIHPFTTFLFLKTLRHSYFKLTRCLEDIDSESDEEIPSEDQYDADNSFSESHCQDELRESHTQYPSYITDNIGRNDEEK